MSGVRTSVIQPSYSVQFAAIAHEKGEGKMLKIYVDVLAVFSGIVVIPSRRSSSLFSSLLTLAPTVSST